MKSFFTRFSFNIHNLFFFGIVLLLSQNLHASNRFVDVAATGANDGTSWANAHIDLQSALAAAISGDTIFVATGTYKPDGASPGNRNLSFNMKTGVVLMGGFPTGGGPLANRNWVFNPTILSGDIGTVGVHTDNSYHVVRCASQQGELNGFIIERGRADGAAPDNDGGGVFITAGYLTSKFCVYRNNFASDQGGGSYHDAGGNPQYRECKFESNSAAFGGGSFLFAATFVTNCVYLNNTATSNGGGVYAVVNINMYNNTFKGNSATTSGNAIYYQSGGSNRLFNSIVWGNTGSGTHIAGAGSINIRSSIIQGGCPGGGATCTNITNVDPLFADALGRLSASSPAIDAGDNATGDANSDGLTIDFDNNNRNFDAIPGGTTRDMGAFENLVANLTQYYVDHTATGSNDGSSWTNAFTSFQSAVAAADNGDAVFVATGTHKPSVGVSQRGKTFGLKNGVKYYGGFPTGGGTMAQRDFVNNRTILSGDIGVANVSTDNAYVVVNASGLSNSTLMSGFTVEAGRADSSGFGHPYGQAGGINIGSNGSMRLDSVTVRNNYGPSGAGVWSDGSVNWSVNGCIFSGNSPGSGVFISGTNVTGTFTNCEFTSNTGNNGGALTFNTTTATHTLTNCSFISNLATASGGGGGVYGGNGNTQTFTNCTFTSNSVPNGPGGGFARFAGPPPTFNNCTFTGNSGGGGFGGGAIYSSSGGFNINQCTFRQNTTVGVTNAHGGACYNNGGTCTVTNSLFWNNSTTLGLGGAIYNNTGGTMNLMNCTFAKNNAGGFGQGGGFNNNSTSNATITNCIFWGNTANGSDAASNTEIGHGSGTLNVSNSIWQGNTTGGTIYNVNPFFTDFTNGNLTLTACSPALDKGTSSGAPSVDLLGNARPFDANGVNGAEFDLGAYEHQSLVSTSLTITTQPSSVNVGVNVNTSFTAAASSAVSPTYQWEVCTDGGGVNFSPVVGGVYSGQTTGTLTITGTTYAMSGYQYRCVITNGACVGTSNAATLTIAVPAGALDFSGPNDYVVSTNNVGITGNQPRTLEYWAVLNPYYTHQVNWGNTTDNQAFGTYVDPSGNLQFYAFGGAADFNTGFLADGNYHHVAVTFDGVTVRTYVDGNPTPTPSAPRTLNTANGRLYIGVREDVHPATSAAGTYEEVRVWNRALCENEIQNSMNCELTGTELGLVINYKFNHGNIGVNNTGVTTVTDNSPNGNSGALVNFALTGTTSNWVAGTVSGSCTSLPSQAYVDKDAVGANDGTSWANAFTSLQSALMCSYIQEVWVAEGTYFPTTGTDRAVGFSLRNNLAVYGGFAGTETLLSQRDIVAHPTVLSGDIGAVNNSADNSYHVIDNRLVSMDSTAILDGFTIRGGNANGTYPYNAGGGILNDNNNSPKIRNCTITNNSANFGAGAITIGITSNSNFSKFESCTFSANTVTNSGGGIYIYGDAGNSIVRISNCTFNNNSAASSNGGAICIGATSGAGNMLIQDCSFSNNTATFGGAIGAVNGTTAFQLNINRCLIENNTATSGGAGIENDVIAMNITRTTIRNNTVWNGSNVGTGGGIQTGGGVTNISNSAITDNKALGTADDGGGNIMIYGGTVNLVNTTVANGLSQTFGGGVSIYPGGVLSSINCILYNNITNDGSDAGREEIYARGGSTANVSYSTVRDVFPITNVTNGGNNISNDPSFVNPGAGNYTLLSSSFALNAGNNASVVGAIDLAGNPRIFHTAVDMGAFELQALPCSGVVFSLITASPLNIAINPGQFITYSASIAVGSIKWYNASNTLVATSNTYVTPVLNSATTYKVKTSIGACESPETVLTVTLKPATTFGGRKAN